jgi:hypothetical protein
VAKSLSTATGQQYTDITLPFQSISVVENGSAFEGDASGSRYRCAIATSSCTRVGAAATTSGGRGGRGGGGGGGRGQAADTPRCAGDTARQPGETRKEVFSSDCTTIAFVQNYNIAIRPAPSPITLAGAPSGGRGSGRGSPAPNYTMLSTDGSEGDAYLVNSIQWSPDSKKLVAIGRSRATTASLTTSNRLRPTRCSPSSYPTVKRQGTSTAGLTGRLVTFSIRTSRRSSTSRRNTRS